MHRNRIGKVLLSVVICICIESLIGIRFVFPLSFLVVVRKFVDNIENWCAKPFFELYGSVVGFGMLNFE